MRTLALLLTVAALAGLGYAVVADNLATLLVTVAFIVAMPLVALKWR